MDGSTLSFPDGRVADIWQQPTIIVEETQLDELGSLFAGLNQNENGRVARSEIVAAMKDSPVSIVMHTKSAITALPCRLFDHFSVHLCRASNRTTAA